MKKILLLLSLLFIVTYAIIAQNLTISSSGQTGTSGTNWNISGNVLTVSGTAFSAAVIQNQLASNSFSVNVSNPTFFTKKESWL